jgi:hypothetical protein
MSVKRLVTDIAARDGLAALVRRQLGRAAKQHTMRLGALTALAGTMNDQVALELGQPAQNRQDQATVRRGGVGPGVVQRPEGGVGLAEDVQQIAG